MLKKRYETQAQMEFVSIEQLVPRDHLLRKIHKTISFDFIRETVEGLYCPDNGRPAIDPVVLFKMLFIGYLFGIRSERQLVKEVEVNIAYRWFLGFGLKDKVPSHSTFSKNRQRRFNDSPIHQEIFDEIVWQAIKREPEVKEVNVSTTAPDSGYMFREGKPKGFFYRDHRTVDGKHNIITDTHVTPGNVHDSIPCLRRLDHQRERFGFAVAAVGLDAG